jgi:uncharacterized protein
MGALLLLACASIGAHAQADRHIFWEVKGRTNTLYLLGSVHMLKPDDSLLPPEVLNAYERSKALVMELDLNDVNMESVLGSGMQSAMLPEGQTLTEVLGPELHAEMAAHAERLGLEPELLDRFQPWFAALLLEQTALAKLGFESGAGVDEQLAQRAQQDGKPIIALETADQQLGFFASLTMAQQRQYLRATLRDLDTEENDAAAIVQAWRRGDSAELESQLRKESGKSPELFHLLTTDRNRQWLPKLTALLAERQDYLVVVGALHLVGNDGVVELLKAQGFKVTQH